MVSMKRSLRSIDASQELHLEAQATADVLARGFGEDAEDARRRTLYHLARGCPDCEQVLEELGRQPADPAVAWDARVRDGVVLGLRHLVELRRRPPPAAGDLAWLRAAHRHWLGLVGVEPLAFARVVVEEVRHSVRQLDRNPELTSALTREALRYLADDPRLEALHPPRFRDVRGLALAYLGDDLRCQGRIADAEVHFRQAEGEISRGTADPEVHTTLSELWADLESSRRLGTAALHRIEHAVRLVRGVAIPGRAAETQVRLGLVRLRLKDPRQAAAAFERAHAALAPGIDFGTRLRAFHYLALAAARSHDFGRALALLDESAELYGDQASQRLRLERLVMLGVSRFETGAAGAAEPLRQAVDRLLELGLWHDAAQALATLGRVYFTTGRPEEAACVDRELGELLRSPAAKKLARTEFRRLWRDLAERGPRKSDVERAKLTCSPTGPRGTSEE
jgi:tetratricopeptide (TPR) repeat protein